MTTPKCGTPPGLAKGSGRIAPPTPAHPPSGSARARRPRHVAGALFAIALGMLLLPMAASAETGALTPLSCLEDNDTAPGNYGACSEATDGLAGVSSIAMSPDASSVYIASQVDDAVVHLQRDQQSGELTPVGCVDDNDPPDGPDTCAESTDGLNGAAVGCRKPGW